MSCRTPTIFLGLALILLGPAPAARLRAADDAKAKDEAREAEAAPILVDLTFKGAIPEDPAPIGLEGAPIHDNLRALVERIGKAKEDETVKGLVVRLRDLEVGWAKSHELRRAIKDFRASGKKAFAVLESAENAEYLIATAADEVVMPESGTLALHGLAAEVTFFKSLFDKLGIHADMLQVGEYKGAGEPFTRTAMSPAFREELTSVLTDSFDLLAEAIAERQGIAVAKAKELINGGPYTPKAALEAGLISRVAYPDELETQIARRLDLEAVKLDPKYGKTTEKVDLSGLAGFFKMMQMLSGEGLKKGASKAPKVAVIYASGMIQTGKSSGGSLMGDAVMGSETVIKHLRQAEKDDTVKAIVLRVDSPGGSALASDLIWREVVRIEKPVVASMSDVAASGGYYISMGCDKVYAEPGTLTGSIGVVGGKLALGGLLEKLGITTDVVTVGEHGRMFSPTKPFSDDERAAVRRLMEETYKQFVGKAARGRAMSFADLEKLAGGRVYTGRQAKQKGLVDELGTLADAVEAARDLAKLDEGTETDLLILPEPKGVLEELFAPLEDRDVTAPGLSAARALLPESARATLARLDRLTRLLAREPAVLVMPFELKIR